MDIRCGLDFLILFVNVIHYEKKKSCRKTVRELGREIWLKYQNIFNAPDVRLLSRKFHKIKRKMRSVKYEVVSEISRSILSITGAFD